MDKQVKIQLLHPLWPRPDWKGVRIPKGDPLEVPPANARKLIREGMAVYYHPNLRQRIEQFIVQKLAGLV